MNRNKLPSAMESDHFEKAKQLFMDALACHKDGNLAGAESLYREALKLVPNRPSVQINLAIVLYQLKRYSEAKELCEILLAANRDHALGWAYLGNSLTYLEESHAASEAYDRALLLNPDVVEAFNYRGRSLLDLRRRGVVEKGVAQEREPTITVKGKTVMWFVSSAVVATALSENAEQALFSSSLASARLRIAVAADAWRKSGQDNIFWTPGEVNCDIDWGVINVCIVPKFFDDIELEPWIREYKAAKNMRCKVVLDICDYPFTKSLEVRSCYAEALKICDAVVVNSIRMAEMMTPHLNRPPIVIEDAILGAAQNPRFEPAERLKLLWFGNTANLPYIRSLVPSLAHFASSKPCRLTILAQDEPVIGSWVQKINADFAQALQVCFIPWSLERMQAALCECDLVLLPSDPSDPRKSGASANRIAEALNAGRFVVASPLPSYLQFKEMAWVGHDLIEGIEWALMHPEKVLPRIRRGQELVAEKFAVDKVGRMWREFFENIISEKI